MGDLNISFSSFEWYVRARYVCLKVKLSNVDDSCNAVQSADSDAVPARFKGSNLLIRN